MYQSYSVVNAEKLVGCVNDLLEKKIKHEEQGKKKVFIMKSETENVLLNFYFIL